MTIPAGDGQRDIEEHGDHRGRRGGVGSKGLAESDREVVVVE